MEQYYDVLLEDACVGQVQVRKEGLYYCFDCLVKLSDPFQYRLTAHAKNQDYDFGLCIPRGEGAGVFTRIPVKRFKDESISFELTDNKPQQKKLFVPIRADEPFPHLQELEKAKLEYQNGVMGACFRD